MENSERDGNTRPSDLPLEKSVQVRKQRLELDMEQQTGSKQGKEYVKAVYCHPAYLTYMQSTSEKEMAAHSSILAWRIPGTEEPGGLQSMGQHRVRHDRSNLAAAAAEYIMRNARLDGAQAGIKIAERNINNLRYAHNTTLMAESK